MPPAMCAATGQNWNPGGAGGGGGNWAGRNWNSASAWVPGSTALFGGAGGAVTVGAQTAGGLTFNTNGYALSAGTLNLTGAPVIDLGKGVTATLAGNLTLTGGGGLTKTGPGTLVLFSAGYAGTTTVQAGTLQFAGPMLKGGVSVATGAVVALAQPGEGAAASLNVDGGTLDLSSVNASSVNALTLGAAASGSAAPALTLKNARLRFDLGVRDADRIVVEQGAASVEGTTAIRLVTGASLSPGVYPLISAPGGGLAGSFQFDGGDNLAVPATSQIKQVGGVWYRLTLQNSATALQVVVAPAPAHVVNILPLGSSSTAGESAVPTYNGGGYRSGLYQALVDDGRFTPNFVGSSALLCAKPAATGYNVLAGAGQIHHEGHGGYTTSDILINLLSNPSTNGNGGGGWLKPGNGINPDYVTLDIGSNDYAYNQRETRAPLDRTDAIISRLATLRPAVHVIVTNLPYRGDRAGTAGALANSHYNPRTPEVVFNHTLAGHHVAFIDGYNAFTPHDSLEFISSDTIHPTQEGYNRLAAAFFRSVVDGGAYWTGRQDNRWNNVAAGNATNFAQDRALAVDRNKSPDAGTDVYFDHNTAGLATALGQNMTVRSVNFTAGATGSVTVAAGNILTLGQGGITVQRGTGAHRIAAGVALGENQTWGNVSTNAFTVSGAISGPGKLRTVSSCTIQVPANDTGNTIRPETRSGTGSFVLSGANTYTGGTTVGSGTLVAANRAGSATGTGEVRVERGATLLDDGGIDGDVSVAGTAAGHGVFAGAVAVRDGGALRGTVTCRGPLNVDGGGQIVLADGALTADGGIVNRGTIRQEPGGILVVGAGRCFVNEGVLDILDDGFRLPAAFVNRGAVIVPGAVRPRSASFSGGRLTLTVAGRPGHAYELQRGDALAAGVFTNVGLPQNAVAGALLTFTDDQPVPGQGFYRVREIPAGPLAAPARARPGTVDRARRMAMAPLGPQTFRD